MEFNREFSLELNPTEPLPLIELPDEFVNRNKNIKLNVGGQIFQTSLATLTKYSESALAIAIEKDCIPRTEEGHFFLDANPDHFKIVLDYLRLEEITTDDVNLLKGTKKVAHGWGLKDLVVALTEKLMNINPKKNLYPSLIRLRFRPEAPIKVQTLVIDQGVGSILEGL